MSAIGALPPIPHALSDRIPSHDALLLARDRTALQQAKDALAAATAAKDAAVLAREKLQAALDAAQVQRAQSVEQLDEARLQSDQIAAHLHARLGPDGTRHLDLKA